MTFKLCRACKKCMYKDHLFSADYECSLTNGGLCFDCGDKQYRPNIENANGSFYCVKCNIRTNEKTPQTRCINCDTALQRVN